MSTEKKVGIVLSAGIVLAVALAGGFGGSSAGTTAPVAVTAPLVPSAPAQPQPNDVTVMDLIPARAGLLSVLTHSKDGLDHSAIGGYKWDIPGKVKLAAAFDTDVATIRCEKEVMSKPAGEDQSCAGRGDKAVAIGPHAGCLSKEDKPGVGALGLSVTWAGCSLFFKVGEMKGRSPSDAVRAAREASDWIDHFRPGKTLPSDDDLRANREQLAVARQIARDRGMR